MPLDTVAYDLQPFARDMDQLKNLVYVERLTVEANTNGLSVTPSVVFQHATVDLSTFSSTSRTMHETEINRIGNLVRVELNPLHQIAWYGVELFVRTVDLNIQTVAGGRISSIPGRSNDLDTSLIFDINPFSFPEDARNIKPIVRRLWIDIVSGSESITPSIQHDDGTTTTLTAITHASRQIAEFNILVGKRARRLTLSGDFTDSGVVLYDISLDLYQPSSRRMAIG